MKLSKNQQKLLVNAIRAFLKEKGYKIKSNTIYTVQENAFIHCDFLIVNSQKMLDYSIFTGEKLDEEQKKIFKNIFKLFISTFCMCCHYVYNI